MLADSAGGLVHSAWCVCKGVRWGRHNEIHEGEMRSASVGKYEIHEEEMRSASVGKSGGGRAGKHACAAVGGIQNHAYGNTLIHTTFHQIMQWSGGNTQVGAGR